MSATEIAALQDVERMLIGACLDQPGAYSEAAVTLIADDITIETHRAIWRAMAEVDSTGAHIDAASVASRLGPDALKAVGGAAALLELVSYCPHQADVGELARGLAAKALARRVQDLCAVDSKRPVEDPETYVQAHEAALYAITETRKQVRGGILCDVADKAIQGIRTEGSVPTIAMPVEAVSRTSGGYRLGWVSVVAARPGVGKTAWLCLSAIRAAEDGHGVVLCSLEMPADAIAIRMVAQLAGVSATSIERGDLSRVDAKILKEGRQWLTKHPIVIEECPGASPAVIRSLVRRAASTLRRRGYTQPLGMAIVDYLQLMRADKPSRSREQDVAECSRALVELAGHSRIAIVAAGQLNRESAKRAEGRPALTDLRESGAIEQDAAVVLGLHRPRDPATGQASGPPEVCILKVRQGGAEGVVQVAWDGPTMTWADTTFRPAPGDPWDD